MIPEGGHSAVEMNTGRDQLESMLVRAACFSVGSGQHPVLSLAPAGVSHLGGLRCLGYVTEG